MVCKIVKLSIMMIMISNGLLNAMQIMQDEQPLTQASYLDRRYNVERQLMVHKQVAAYYAFGGVKALSTVTAGVVAAGTFWFCRGKYPPVNNLLMSVGIGVGTGVTVHLLSLFTNYLGTHSLLTAISQKPIRRSLNQLERSYYAEEAIRARRGQAPFERLLNAIDDGNEEEVGRLLAPERAPAFSIQHDDTGRTPFFYAIRAYFGAKGQQDTQRIESSYRIVERIIQVMREHNRNISVPYSRNPFDTITVAAEKAIEQRDGRLIRLLVANGNVLPTLPPQLSAKLREDQGLIRLFTSPDRACPVCEKTLFELDHERQHLCLLDCSHVMCNACFDLLHAEAVEQHQFECAVCAGALH